MALEDKDIFNAICTRFNDQPIEFIMEQYEKARKLNAAIESRVNTPPVESSLPNKMKHQLLPKKLLQRKSIPSGC